MKQLKKTLLTLVALLAVTTGAWAQTETLLTTITATSKDTYSETTSGVVTVTHDNDDFFDEYGWVWYYQAGSITVEAKDGYTITKCVFSQPDDKTVTVSTAPFKVNFIYNGDCDQYRCEGTDPDDGMDGVASIEVYGYAPAASSGPTVTWTAASKTGSFTMPGGNVTLEPDYYPQATAAEGAVTAATDAKATTDAPLVTIDETKLTGAKKLMYYVSTDATAPAYDAVGWTDQLPTAENYTQAATLNVWYYPVGTVEGVDDATATYSDGDICATALTVSLGAAPTYAVTLNAEGLSTDEAAAWKVAKGTDQPAAFPLEGVTKGQTVTVNYNGSKKVIGVKAEKKTAPASTPLDNTTTAWTAGTYAVPAGGLTYSDAITVSGDVTLVLTDGETLTLNKGISLASGATLTIQGNGTMNVNGTSNSTASTVAGSTGTLVLTSGTLTATGGKGQDATDPEQTGASGGAAINGSVTVNGGSLTATGGNGGNCIGATIGFDTYAGAGGAAISGDVTITDGAVAATGGNGGSIGASNFGMGVHGGAGGAAIGGNATLTGGTLTATQGANGTGSLGDSSVGIGGKAVAGTVTNNGGTVNQ